MFANTLFHPQILSKPLTRLIHLHPLHCTPGDEVSSTARPPNPPPQDTVEIRFRRGSRSRRQQKQQQEAEQAPKKQKEASPPKKWEEMSFSEKALELYVGEKGALFWLNKFAYASIYIIIGAWILFRFVGPAFNLYQLDTPPLAPDALFKGS